MSNQVTDCQLLSLPALVFARRWRVLLPVFARLPVTQFRYKKSRLYKLCAVGKAVALTKTA